MEACGPLPGDDGFPRKFAAQAAKSSEIDKQGKEAPFTVRLEINIGKEAMTYIEELKDVIRKLHGVESTHRQSVPVKEVFRGEQSGKASLKYSSCTVIPRRTQPTRGPMPQTIQRRQDGAFLYFMFPRRCRLKTAVRTFNRTGAKS